MRQRSAVHVFHSIAIVTIAMLFIRAVIYSLVTTRSGKIIKMKARA
jgi:hypothetical protein